MILDVVYVTFNSEKWIEPCFESWRNRLGGNQINVIVVDNASMDGTVELLERTKQKFDGYFSSFQIIRLTENKGFGAANNIGFKYGAAEIVCFFNIDTEILDLTMSNLSHYLSVVGDDTGVWELRQMPYEHPKVYDPVTQEVSWCSGAAFAVRRKVFEEVGGFDECFFMYAEDVDLSWRIRQKGYRILYCPNTLICHNTYAYKGEIKFTQYAYGMRNNLLMRNRYGSLNDIVQGYVLLLKMLLKSKMGWELNRKFLAVVNTHWKMLPYIWKSRKRGGIKAYFYGLDYSKARQGAFYKYRPVAVKVRIVVFVLASARHSSWEIKRCIEQQVYPVFGMYCVHSMAEIEGIIGNMESEENIWISIVNEHIRIYADHYETLAGAVMEGCEVIGSIDSSGELPDAIGYYIFSRSFYEKNKAGNLEMSCRNSAVCVEKQTCQ